MEHEADAEASISISLVGATFLSKERLDSRAGPPVLMHSAATRIAKMLYF